MYKINKILSVCFALLLIVTATVSGTLAYESWTAQQYAENTTETLTVKLLTQQRTYNVNGNVIGLTEFVDNKQLIPMVGSAQYDGTNFDKYGMPVADGYVDQIVRVQNTGTASAYVRVIVAVPAALDDANDAGHNALHWNLGNRFRADGTFSAENSTNPAFSKISWQFAETAEVGGVECNIYIFTYEEAIEPGGITEAAAFVGFYLDSSVDIVNGHILLDGVDTGFTDDSVKIHVTAQAVQSYGIKSAQDAFSSLSGNPWMSVTP